MWLKLFASLGLYIWCYEICESDANVATADNDEMKRYDERVLKNSCTYPQKAFDILIKKMCPIAEPFCIIDKPFDSLSQMHFRCATALHRENNRVLVLNSSELLSIIADDAEEMGLPRCMLTAFISPECIFTARMAQYFNVLPLLFPQLRIVAIDATIFSKFFRLNSRYGISGTPTIILWVDGVALARMDEAPFSVKAFKDFIQRWTDLEYASNFRLDVNSIPGPLSSKLDLYWIIMNAFVV
ncbi:unnamed protein product [Dracunculus medinensis]|uniref:Thioredoxin domain-containing protein n=1 Tax=Dracunculus medinensis TaxID=318479 RepID=A0A0N4U9U0_DRAME|nr:unnamed protein product [Dracunculus medinensis]